MKNRTMFIVMLLLATKLVTGCKKSANVDKVAPPNTQPGPAAPTSFVDPLTPAGVQPYILDANGAVVKTPSTPYASGGYTIAFSDEFNSTSLDASKWNATVSNVSRAARTDKGIAGWFWKPDHVSINGSDLLLKASRADNSTMYCGSVDSKSKFEPQYGYMEVRIDNADVAKAVHTAFWLQGANQANINGSGDDGCEVDIFESAFSNGAHTQSTLHWDGYGTATKAWTKHWDNVSQFGSNIHQGYHIIALEWTPTSLNFYYDGVKTFDYVGVGIPLVKEWLWLSVGASFGDGDFLSQSIGELTTAKVDWIRVYQKN